MRIPPPIVHFILYFLFSVRTFMCFYLCSYFRVFISALTFSTLRSHFDLSNSKVFFENFHQKFEIVSLFLKKQFEQLELKHKVKCNFNKGWRKNKFNRFLWRLCCINYRTFNSVKRSFWGSKEKEKRKEK